MYGTNGLGGTQASVCVSSGARVSKCLCRPEIVIASSFANSAQVLQFMHGLHGHVCAHFREERMRLMFCTWAPWRSVGFTEVDAREHVCRRRQAVSGLEKEARCGPSYVLNARG